MYPFYYPTSTIIIDDEPLLLESLTSCLDDKMFCKCFTDADQALEHILTQYNSVFEIENFFSVQPDSFDLSVSNIGDIFIKLKTSYWYYLLQKVERFSEFSTVIVDYSMPKMDGLELCRKLKHLPMKKIMLTGLASQEIAIHAFNEKIIDSFILKHDNNFLDKLVSEINSLKKAYFEDKTRSLKLAFSLQETQFINERAFQGIFNQIIDIHSIAEYYLNSQPPGVLMFDNNGNPKLLLVYDNERLRAHFEIAAEYGAPNDLLKHIASSNYIPFFPTQSGYYDPSIGPEWQEHFYPAQKLYCSNTWYISPIIDATFVLEHLDNYVSLEEYQKLLSGNGL